MTNYNDPTEQTARIEEPMSAEEFRARDQEYARQMMPNIVINNSAVATASGGYVGPQRSTTTAYVLLLLLGVVGAHKFYLGRPGMGVAYLLTLGFLGVGLVYDLFTLGRQTRMFNAGVR